MGTVNAKCEIEAITIDGRSHLHPGYSSRELEKFGPVALGLGNIAEKSKQIDVIAAVFDLAGFTDFCSHVDPHLSLPKFLNSFLDWLFASLRSELEIKEDGKGNKVHLWTELPFFAKFMGDGVLFLWNVENLHINLLCNIVVCSGNISGKYNSEFVPKMKKKLPRVPKMLRCGAARGMVCSVGNGEDYVGPCINIASRLQKLSSLRICASINGIDYEEGMKKETAANWVVKSVPIRGIGEEELVMIHKEEFEKLPPKDKVIFKDV